MTRLGAGTLGLAALGMAALAGCGAPDAGVSGSGSAPVPVDSSLADLIADLALADARAELAPAPRRAAVRDSLRETALGLHGVSADEARDRQARLARDPAVARATYDAVERALMSEPR